MKQMVKTVLALLLLAAFTNSSAQKNNYLKENTMENFKAGRNEVMFKSQALKLAGLLFTPENFDSNQKYPTVVFSGPFNQIKEQMGAVYGEKFANKGYVFLSFDHLGYGDSEGEIRDNENSFIKMESIRDAISYLGTLDFVDKTKIYGLGGCASGGYMPLVAVTDKRMAAIATVSGMMDNKTSYFGMMTKEQLMPIFEMANAARQKAYETGEVEYYDALNMANTDPSNEGYDYYMTARAGRETYPNYSHLAPMFLMENAPLTSATSYAPYLYTPYLGIIGENTVPEEGETPSLLHTGPLTVDFYNAASEPKELYKVPGASHVSLYDIDKDVDKAVDKMVEFFTKYSK
ncbi:alpha/beta hydrolase [Marinifilum caeruleilacunae]|uniref:Alpha/beta hydrolase n=1 Tax=Marinifilum caeruleilacunae TaxID=2499076 RepID=A0ABX1WQK1_9BACT|nr:alpha/beta hydrolase [Marinifilum caeruleilacunae]NOU58365.1 alpha/beta hydrolase [Marinifilum caeruleilacunae]